MSYTNGIGNAQQHIGAAEAAASSSTIRPAKTEPSSVSVPVQVESSKPAPVDDANVSTTAGVMAQALSGSDVRTEKVAALQQSIAAGAYNIPASDVAAKLLSSLLR